MGRTVKDKSYIYQEEIIKLIEANAKLSFVVEKPNDRVPVKEGKRESSIVVLKVAQKGEEERPVCSYQGDVRRFSPMNVYTFLQRLGVTEFTTRIAHE